MTERSSPAELLAAYDRELRTDAETPSAVAMVRLGPLRLVTFAGGEGFITYRDLGGAQEPEIRALVAGALEHYRRDPAIRRVEWKTRGHDHAPGLAAALLARGFVADEPETIMIGDARGLAVDVALPAGIRLRTVTTEPDVRAMCDMLAGAFGDEDGDDEADALLRRLTLNDGMELWIAEAGSEMVGAGRLEPVADSRFAGIWGGAIAPPWRGQGIYRALTAARARSALRCGRTLIHSDSNARSRPILERSGMVGVSTTTPYIWRR